IRPQRGTLWMPFAVRRQRGFEVRCRRVELSNTGQRRAHRMMRLAAARWIREAASEGLLRDLARAFQVAEHETERECDPQPPDGHLSPALTSRQREQAVPVLAHFEPRLTAGG